jgi:hypothetical protein
MFRFGARFGDLFAVWSILLCPRSACPLLSTARDYPRIVGRAINRVDKDRADLQNRKWAPLLNKNDQSHRRHSATPIESEVKS